MKPYPTRPLLIAAITVSLFGCSRNGEVVDPTPSDAGATESVVKAQWDSMSVAFDRLSEGRIIEQQFVEVWRRGETQASRRATLEYEDGQRLSLVTTDSTGTFERGWINTLIGPLTGIKTPIAHWTDGEPPYQSPRRRTLFRFSALPDSVVDGVTVVRHRVTARTADEPLRRARFALLPSNAAADTSGLQVIGLDETRLEDAPFFEQGSSIVVQLALRDGRWEAKSIIMDVSVDAPARAVRRYRVERVFSR